MRATRIIDLPDWSWKRRVASFLGIAGATWLLIEPIPVFFGSAALLSSVGSLGYSAWLILAVLLTIAGECYSRLRRLGRMSFIRLTVVLQLSGTVHLVEAPRDMQIGRFVDLFLAHVSERAGPDAVLRQSHMYENTLVVESDGAALMLPRSLTIRKARLKDNDTCAVCGIILDEYESVLYQIRSFGGGTAGAPGG